MGVCRMEGRHEINLVGRRELAVTGVTHVEHYDRQEVVVATSMGLLVIRGEELSIDQLNIEEGRLQARGLVVSLTYSDQEKVAARGRGWWQKVWR